MSTTETNATGVLTHGKREIAWSIRFEEDLHRLYTEQLRSRGYHPDPETTVSELGRLFHDLFRRRLEHLEGKPLDVHYAREMAPHRDHGAVARIAELAKQGKPLWPYTSKTTKNARFSDGLLNHWGVFHFHLGETFEPSGYTARTDKLLYAWVTQKAMYILGVLPHSFAEDGVLNVVLRNWPDVLEPYRLRGTKIETSPAPSDLVTSGRMKEFTRTVLVHPTTEVSPTHTKDLRELGVSATFEGENGDHYYSPGGGLSCAGTGIAAQIRADHEHWWARQLGGCVRAEMEQVFGSIPADRRPASVDALEFHLESLEELRAARVVEQVTRTRVQLPLEFDHEFDPVSVIVPSAAASMVTVQRGD